MPCAPEVSVQTSTLEHAMLMVQISELLGAKVMVASQLTEPVKRGSVQFVRCSAHGGCWYGPAIAPDSSICVLAERVPTKLE